MHGSTQAASPECPLRSLAGLIAARDAARANLPSARTRCIGSSILNDDCGAEPAAALYVQTRACRHRATACWNGISPSQTERAVRGVWRSADGCGEQRTQLIASHARAQRGRSPGEARRDEGWKFDAAKRRVAVGCRGPPNAPASSRRDWPLHRSHCCFPRRARRLALLIEALYYARIESIIRRGV